jgi:dTDP-4-dehydrorhamnose 3,5-epimerase
MKVTATALTGVLLLEPKVFRDERGFFLESWNRRTFSQAVGFDADFVQDNHSRSAKGVLRGLHYQLPPRAQGKLVRVTRGTVFDVAVDVRRSSSTFGRWVGVELTESEQTQLWIPPGFAHGFVVLSETADFLYKTTEFYEPAQERVIRYDDPDLGISWPLPAASLSVAPRDSAGPALSNADVFD